MENVDDIFAEFTNQVSSAVKAEPDTRAEAIAALVTAPTAEQAKPKYRTVDKVPVAGGPDGTLAQVYPAGYINIKQEGWRFNNHVCLWVDQLEQWAAFFRDTAKSDAFIASLQAAGAKRRGEG